VYRHGGYGEPQYDEIDRILFYLSVANGWTRKNIDYSSSEEEANIELGHDRDGNRQYKSKGDLRRLVAKKAFEVLCQSFFKVVFRRGSEDDEYNWKKMFVSDRLLPAILHYFRVERLRGSAHFNIINISSRTDDRSPHDEIAEAFLLRLVHFLWTWRKEERYFLSGVALEKAKAEQEANEVRVKESKPWTVEVLNTFQRLDELWQYQLDEPVLAKLREIAMRLELYKFRHPVLIDRPVLSLEEACLVGSRAAEFLLLRDVVEKEKSRLREILTANREIEEAERRLRELTGEK
jgi:hypothetical protein